MEETLKCGNCLFYNIQTGDCCEGTTFKHVLDDQDACKKHLKTLALM